MSIDNEVALIDFLRTRRPVLLLGAGFSYGTKSVYGCNNLLAEELRKELIREFYEHDQDISEIESYTLRQLCDLVVEENKQEQLHSLLRRHYSRTIPHEEHSSMCKYVWDCIYTFNIDDLVENVYQINKYAICVQNQHTRKQLKEKETELVKLHGCVNALENGIVFSSDEYYDSMNQVNWKFKALLHDMFNKDFVILGAQFDEVNIQYFLREYMSGGYDSSRGKVFYVNPNPPSRLMRAKLQNIEAIIVQWDTKRFLNEIGKIVEDCSDAIKIERQFERKGYTNILRYKEELERKVGYESSLYQGDYPIYDDFFNEWDFINPYIGQIEANIRSTPHQASIVSLTGYPYVGKTCIAMRIAVNLQRTGYSVFEFTGNSLSISDITCYLESSSNNNVAILIDDASGRYSEIRNIFSSKIPDGKKILFILIANLYMHEKKKYQIMSDVTKEYIINKHVSTEYADIIVQKLNEKNSLGHIAKIRENQRARALTSQMNDLIDAIFRVSHGKGFEKYYSSIFDSIFSPKTNADWQNLLLHVYILTKLNIEFYPIELVTQHKAANIADFCSEYGSIISLTDKGLKLRGISIWRTKFESTMVYKQNKVDVILQTLRYIAVFMNERENSKWYIIVEYIMKEVSLNQGLGLSLSEIKELYLEIEPLYSNISYYWLQRGLLEQKMGDFDKAHMHLEQAAAIRPNSYQIKHAIGRNHFRQALTKTSIEEASPLFNTGELYMKELISTQEYRQGKAYSISCYVKEKINFINRFSTELTSKEIKYIDEILDNDAIRNDPYFDDIRRKYLSIRLLASNPPPRVVKLSDLKEAIYSEEQTDDFE